MNGDRSPYSWLPAIGCLTILAVLSLIVLMPLVLVNLMRSALERLHLSPAAALISVIGIFVGSLFNLPVYRIRRDEMHPVNAATLFGPLFWAPRWQRLGHDTVIAINVGGCVIPMVLVPSNIPAQPRSSTARSRRTSPRRRLRACRLALA